MTGNAMLAVLTTWMVCGALFTYLIYRFVYYRTRQRENMYFLFAVRDQMIRLLVDGKLEEDEFLFREFYPFVNYMIVEVNSLRFKHILKALEHERWVVSEGFRAKFLQEISGKDRDVVELFNRLFQLIPAIIYRNSLMFRIVFRIASVLGIVRRALLAAKNVKIGSVARVGIAYEYSVAFTKMVQ